LTPLGVALTHPVNALREWVEANISWMLATQQRFDLEKRDDKRQAQLRT
jgi:hypothetical protein